MVAIIPAAGLGTRMEGLTGGKPKELLSVGGKPVVRWTIEEAFGAGADRVIVVSSENKPELNDYIAGLRQKQVDLAFQNQPRGLAHAVCCAQVLEEPALLLMGDTIFPFSSPLSSIKEALSSESKLSAAVAIRRVPRDQVSRYGIVDFDEPSKEIRRVVEKPPVEDAKSDWAVSGRYGFGAQEMAAMKQMVAEWNREGEINLTMMLNAVLKSDGIIEGVPLSPDQKLFDCGDPEGYAVAVSELGQ